MKDDITKCKNCQHPLVNNARFCANCGQSAKSLHRPFKSVIYDTLHESLDIDGRLMLTIKTLLFKPGRLSLDYNLGKRVKYTPPLRMYLVISIMFFLILSQFDLTQTATELYSGQTKDQLGAIYALFPKLMFVLLPLFALILKMLYRETYYISNLVFAVHFHCFAYVILVVMLPLESIEKAHPIFVVLQLPLFFYLIYYLVFAIKLTYQQNWLKTIGKSLLLAITYISLVMISIESIQNGFSSGLFG
jgi:hypothetical protein